MVDFLVTARPSDLYQARGYDGPRDLEVELEAEFGDGAIARGREVYATNCARCHSSQAGPFDANSDFHGLDKADPSLRADWLGNDQPTPATEVGTYYLAWRYYSPTAPEVAFVIVDEALADPDEPWRRHVIDFAELEHAYPLSREDRTKITPESLRALSQEQVDQIYGRLPAGPIPDGMFHGGLFFPKGEDEYSRLGELVGGIAGRKVDVATSKLEFLASRLWKGKLFDREQLVLRNLVDDREFLDQLIGDDAARLQTIEVERLGPLSWVLPTRTTWLLFPAKLYCGQSLLDGRRESIIIDYAYNDDLGELYHANPDHLVGRKGMRIRDEIRMVRPGFYLGRAYLNRVFALNFTLYNPEIAEAQEDAFLAGESIGADCWPEAEQLSASRG